MPKFTSKTATNESAVFASSGGGPGVEALSLKGPGVTGKSTDGRAGQFHSDNQEGVFGDSNSPDKAAVAGVQLNAAGTGAGVYGEHKGTGPGVVGTNTAAGPGGVGGFFHSEVNTGVHAETKSPTTAAVACFQLNPVGTGAALYAEHIAGKVAGFFKGDVIVTGDVSFPGADCAEDFTIRADADAEPGTVMALCPTGELVPCVGPYEKKVVGVVAGAGAFRPGIVMDRHGPPTDHRRPIALVGKVYCKLDADFGPVEVGDLLTSSPTPGHAMKAADPERAFGSVIGKAMAPLRAGRGLIPILISLQ
jgi:hypothetical protein